jgi:hypothetical protein
MSIYGLQILASKHIKRYTQNTAFFNNGTPGID